MVALLIPITNKPDAFLSNVPVCPAFFILYFLFSSLTVSDDVIPFYLLINKNPDFF